MIVCDTNLIVHLLVGDERRPLAEAALRRDAHWVAPPLWRSEFRNVLALYMRRGLLGLPHALQVAERAELLMEGRDLPVPSAEVLRLASRSGRSAYDCEFVALAQDLGIPLVTSDRAVLAAFPSVAVSLDGFAR